jgi:hypothetical protein
MLFARQKIVGFSIFAAALILLITLFQNCSDVSLKNVKPAPTPAPLVTLSPSTEASPTGKIDRGCTDDNSVPIVREINFETEPGTSVPPYPLDPADLNWKYVFDRPMRNSDDAAHSAFCAAHPEQPYPSQWPAYYQPPSCENVANVVAVKLKVVTGGGRWYLGGLQIGATRGTSTAEAVISRCRGRFDQGGRVQVVSLDNYQGAENQSSSVFFPSWVVDPIYPTDRYTAKLTSPGKTAADGWISDGIYYINVRQTWCNGSAHDGGICWRSFSGQGSSRDQVIANTGREL